MSRINIKEYISNNKKTIFLDLIYIVFVIWLVTFTLNIATSVSNINMNTVFGDSECRYKSPTNSTNDVEYKEVRDDGIYCCADVYLGTTEYERDPGTLSYVLFGKTSYIDNTQKLCNKLKWIK